MYSIIFCGGAGKRTWPLSTTKEPKYLLPVPKEEFGGKSSYRLTVERAAAHKSIGWKRIFIAGAQENLSKISTQSPEIPKDHYIGEPCIRDLGAAVGLSAFVLQALYEKEKVNPETPFGIFWSDALLENVLGFDTALKAAEELVSEDPDSMIFLGHKPTFANPNLGWIRLGKRLTEKEGVPIHELSGWQYRPSLEEAEALFERGDAWNLGNFFATPKFVISLYERFAPKMVGDLETIVASWGKLEWQAVLNEIYPTLPSIHFDNLIIEPFAQSELKKKGKVLVVDLGWRDIGSWTATWEYLPKDKDGNAVLGPGEVVQTGCRNCLLVNVQEGTILTAIGQENKALVRTKEATLMFDLGKDGEIKKLMEVMTRLGLGGFL